MSAAVVALALLLQAAPPSPQEVQLDDVVVEGRIPEELARDFIDQVANAPRGASVARWNREVCVGVIGLRSTTAQYLIDRVATVAESLDVETGEPGCEPNVVIAATTDGGAAARALVERRRNVLAPGNNIQSRGRRDLEAFVETDRPVRWWHVSTAVDPEIGRSVVRMTRHDNFDSNDPKEVVEQLATPVRGASSLLTSTTRQDLRRAVVIIDFDQLGEVDFDQLADYVAFVALAQVDPDADTSGFETILNLFDNPSTPGLSDWDRAYLHGLYRSDDSARGAAAREAALRREMMQARAGGAASSEVE
ncbi:hypothetical protein [Brevundimonas sp.]